jgi:hypothetical protein
VQYARFVAAEGDGTIMMEGFFDTEPTRSAGQASLAGRYLSGHLETGVVNYLRAAVGWLPVVVILGIGAWLPLSGFAKKPAESKPVRLATVVASQAAPPMTVGMAKDPSFDPATAEAITPGQPAPVDGLKISSQSWRRGGLGSNAFVTFTLRNSNDYAVKDIEISCAFARRDGSHLTGRKRLIHETVGMKSRKTFARMHVGFVNINANQAKCSLVTASRI